ncbi:MAG: alpha/beta fold hydrolase [Kofleriaceae bacterium]
MPWPSPYTKHHTLALGTITAHVAEAGTGAPAIFLHGNPDTHAVWNTTIAALPHLRCLAPDLPGFGKSSAPVDHDLSLEAQGAFVLGIADALELERVHVVVHDIGGNYGLAFASLHPQRVASLTIFNTIWSPNYRWHFWGRVWRTRGLGEVAMKLTIRPLFINQIRRGSPAMPRDYAVHAYGELTPATRRHVLRYYRAMSPAEWQGWDTKLRAAKLPTQVIWGDQDPFIPATFADGFGVPARHLPHGHWLMVEDPELAAGAIADFTAKSLPVM